MALSAARYLAPRFFAPRFWGAIVDVVPVPVLASTRDGKVLDAIAAMIADTGYFRRVVTWNEADRARIGDDDLPAAILFLLSSANQPESSPRLVLHAVRFGVTIADKAEEDYVAGDRADSLEGAVRNAIMAGRTIGGRVIPRYTLIDDGAHDETAHPLHYLTLTGSFAYPRRVDQWGT